MQRIARRLLRRPFEAEYKILQHIEIADGLALDIGANRGQSLDAIRLYHPQCKVVSYEPNKALYDKLVKRSEHDPNLTFLNFGLGSESVEANLFVPYYRDFLYDGLSSFTEDRAADWLNAETVWRFKPELLRIERHACRITTLDSYSYAPVFAKIHVQGFELDVIRGGEQTLSEHCPVLLIANHHDADLWLRERGWQQYVLRGQNWVHLAVNDMRIYNSVYLHPLNASHRNLIKTIETVD